MPMEDSQKTSWKIEPMDSKKLDRVLVLEQRLVLEQELGLLGDL